MIQNVVPNLKTTGIQATRGNDLRIFKPRFKYDLRKFYFTNKSSLPNWIVMANSTINFKRRLDIYIGKTRRLSTIFVHCSYMEPEVVVTYLDMTK